MLGSLTNYRRLLRTHVFAPRLANGAVDERYTLSPAGHGVAGILAGWTVSFIAAPIEHVKARLQIQYAKDKSARVYKGPVDATKKIIRAHGMTGLYQGLFATLIFRSFFFFWWSTYDIFTNAFRSRTTLSEPAINFWAGGLSAQMFWLFSYPSDVVKQRIMTDGWGKEKKYHSWRQAAVTVYKENGWRGYWRGFVPCFLRAFPANAVALVVFEGAMRAMA